MAAATRPAAGDATNRSKSFGRGLYLSLVGYCSVSASGSPLRAASARPLKALGGSAHGKRLPRGSRSEIAPSTSAPRRRRPTAPSPCASNATRREKPLSGSRNCASMVAQMRSPATQLRYALYLAPPTESELWRFGSDVIGRDAMTGASCDGFALEGYPPASWRNMTSEPRRYGFHATLKAPFRRRVDLGVRFD